MNPIADDGPAVDNTYSRDGRSRPYDPRCVPASLFAPTDDFEHPRSKRDHHRETSAGHEFYSADDTGNKVILTDLAVPLRAWH